MGVGPVAPEELLDGRLGARLGGLTTARSSAPGKRGLSRNPAETTSCTTDAEGREVPAEPRLP